MTHLASLNAAFDIFEPHPDVRCIEWSVEHAWTFEGKPFMLDAYPHLGAPGGPCDAIDDSEVRRIIMQFASRLGKTFIGQCALLKWAACDPAPMMFASSTEQNAADIVQRTYKMMYFSATMRRHLRPEHLRTQKRIDFKACQCYVAWARSTSTLADKEAQYGEANEVDKWDQPGAASGTAREADPLKLFLDRFKNKQSQSKVIIESTPQVKGKSRIEAARLGSSNCQFHVPCPHCERYQLLDFERVKWDKNEAGKSDKDLARRTARYECQHCQGEILDHHRPPMMRLGVWCPEGCTVKDREAKAMATRYMTIVNARGGDGESLDDYRWRGWGHADWIDGTPLRDGPDAGYQLSSLYALSLSWGDVAAEFVSSKSKPQDLRNFINQWLAQTWELAVRETTWEQLGNRVINRDVSRGVVPSWASLLTIGIDRQMDNGTDRFPWVVDAWGPKYRVATIVYGQETSFEDLEGVVVTTFPHFDGNSRLPILWGLFDSGFLPKGVDDFCHAVRRRGVAVFPCKGSSQAMHSTWSEAILGPRTSRPGEVHYLVDTSRTQLWIEGQVRSATKDDESGYSLFAGSLMEHQDFLEQLLNDWLEQKPDATNNIRESWKRVDENIPNDYRACRRYAYAAMLIATRGAPILPRNYTPPRVVEEDGPRFKIRDHKIRR